MSYTLTPEVHRTGKWYFDHVRDLAIKMLKVQKRIGTHTCKDDMSMFDIPDDSVCNCSGLLDEAQEACNNAYEIITWIKEAQNLIKEVANPNRCLDAFDKMARQEGMKEKYTQCNVALDSADDNLTVVDKCTHPRLPNYAQT